MTEQQVREDITFLHGRLSSREGKYIRNMNRYMNNGVRRESLWEPYVWPQAYVSPAQGTEGTQTQINVIKSCIDTITSKISQANVRPFFDPDDGSFATTKACRQIQKFSDIWLDEQHAYPKSVMCFRDAACYDIGIIHVDAETQSIRRVAPWEYFIDPAEYYHGAVSRAMILKKYFPLAGLIGQSDNKELREKYDENRHLKGEYAIYYDLVDGLRYDFFDHHMIKEPVKLDYEKYGGLYRRPFVEIYYTKPMKGFFSVSLADDLYPIQRQIDEIVRRLDSASRQALNNLILVPKGSGLKASTLENGVKAYDWQPGPEGGAPIVMTPPAINPQFIEMLKMYIDQAFQTAGISQLSAQSKKPTGLDSGAALKTMEDIESDRFNVQLQQFTHFLVDVLRVAIDCFPSNKSILPKKKGVPSMTWGEVRKQRDLFNIDFSAASALSKDPSAKIAEINALLQMGYIDDEIGASLLQMPDLRGVYSIATSSIDYVQKIIDDAVENEDYEFEETVNVGLLFKQTITNINRYAASGDNEAVKRLKELTKEIFKLKNNIAFVESPPLPLPPGPSEGVPGPGQMPAPAPAPESIPSPQVPVGPAIPPIGAPTGRLPSSPPPIQPIQPIK